MEQGIHAVAHPQADAAYADLGKKVHTYGADIHAFAYGMFLAAVDVAEGLHTVANFQLRTAVGKEVTAFLEPMLPLGQDGYAEEKWRRRLPL